MHTDRKTRATYPPEDEELAFRKELHDLLGAYTAYRPKVSFSTGSFVIDQALTSAGFPQGHMCEIYGESGSGKTTLALHAIKHAISQNKTAVFFDIEHTLSMAYVTQLGIDATKLIVIRPQDGDEAFDMMNFLVKEDIADIIVVDSTAALISKQDMNRPIEQQSIDNTWLNQRIKSLHSWLKESHAACIFISQTRMQRYLFSDYMPQSTGGNCLSLYTNICLYLSIKSNITNNQEHNIGLIVEYIIKQGAKHAFRSHGTFPIFFNRGIDYHEELLEAACRAQIIKKSSNGYLYDNQELTHAQIIQELRTEPIFAQIIKIKSLQILFRGH